MRSPAGIGSARRLRLSEASAAIAFTVGSHENWETGSFACGQLDFATEEFRTVQLQLDGIGDDRDAGWTPAQWDDYLKALKEEGRRYRPKYMDKARTDTRDRNPVRTLQNRIARAVRADRRKRC